MLSGRVLRGLPVAVIAMALSALTLRAQTAGPPALLFEEAPARGAFSSDLRTRYYLIPSHVVSGLKLEPALAIRWSRSDRLALTLDAQTVDNSGPGRQGRYFASRTLPAEGAGRGNFFQEQALGVRWRVGNSCGTGNGFVLGGSVSRGARSYVLRDTASGASPKATTSGSSSRQLTRAWRCGALCGAPR